MSYHSVRADHDALATLDAQVSLPDRDLQRQVAFLPLGCAGREGTVHRKCGYGDIIAVEPDDGTKDIAHKFGAPIDSLGESTGRLEL